MDPEGFTWKMGQFLAKREWREIPSTHRPSKRAISLTHMGKGLVSALLVWAFYSPLATAANGDGYTVLLYGDERVIPEARVGREIRRLELAYGRPVLAYSTGNIREFDAVMNFATRTKIPIKNLFVRGIHGDNLGGTPTLEVRANGSRQSAFTSFGELQESGVRLNLLPGAVVFFDSCSMVDNSTQPKILKAFNEIKRIGFSTGSIYLNQTVASYGVANTFAIPFYSVPGTWLEAGRVLAGQVIWPLVLPIFYYLDRFQNNQGYLYQDSGTKWTLTKMYAGDVEEGRISRNL